jgi:hypothetical protein
LHERRIAELRAADGLVGYTGLDVGVFESANAFRHDHRAHSFKEFFAAADQARFDERRFALHVAVRDFDAIFDRAD